MKIENNKPDALTGPADSLTPTAPTAPASSAGKSAAAPGKGDQLSVSAEARLLKAAEAAASATPAIRAELVEKMRALLAEGKIGHDAVQLAESLIDDLRKNG